MEYSNMEDLKIFLDLCDQELLGDKRKKIVNYPDDIDVINSWDSEKIKKANEKLLKDISGSANVYAIYVGEDNNSEYFLKYIGQTISNLARTRLTNHLFKKHKKTGAKLEKVISEVKSGKCIKISWISIKPESLRHYIEEELIKRHKEKLEWNTSGKKA